MAIEGVNEWEKQKAKGLMSDESFHLDPKREAPEPVEELLEKFGPNGAFDELADRLPPDTNQEVVRQMKVIVNKLIKKNQH